MGWLRSRSSVQLALTVLLALVLAYGVQRYLVGIFRVPSDSMARTLLPGDRLLAARFWYSIERPTRGDIVVLHPNGRGDRVFYADTASRRVFVKRIIGLPGRLGEGPPRPCLDLHRAGRHRLRAARRALRARHDAARSARSPCRRGATS